MSRAVAFGPVGHPMQVPQIASRFSFPLSTKSSKYFSRLPIELRDEVEGRAELRAGADVPAGRPDQAQHRRRLRESHAGRVPKFSKCQRLREFHEIRIRLEWPHAGEFVHLAVAVLHDEAGVTQVPRGGARASSCLLFIHIVFVVIGYLLFLRGGSSK